MAARQDNTSQLADTPRTRLAMLRIGIVPQIFYQQAPTLYLQLKLEQELYKLTELVQEERNSIVANGIPELEFKALGCPDNLKSYVVAEPVNENEFAPVLERKTTIYVIGGLEKPQRKTDADGPIQQSYKVLRYSTAHLYQVNQAKAYRLAYLQRERVERMQKTIRAQQFAQKIITERLELRKQQFLYQKAKLSLAYAKSYQEYYRLQREKIASYENHIKRENELAQERERQNEARQQVRRQIALQKSLIAEERVRQVLASDQQMRDQKRLTLQRHYYQVEMQLEKYKREVAEKQRAQSQFLAQSLTKAGYFLASKEEAKREKYIAEYVKRFSQVEERKYATSREKLAQSSRDEARYFLLRENYKQLHRQSEYKMQQFKERLNKPLQFDFAYCAPAPREGEKQSYTIEEAIEQIREASLRNASNERMVKSATQTARQTQDSPNLANYVRAIEAIKRSAEQIKRENTHALMALGTFI